MLNACFPSGSLDLCCVLSRGHLCQQAPVKTFGTESLMSLLDTQCASHVATVQFWKNYMRSVRLHRERPLGSLGLVSSRLRPVLFSFACFAL